MPTPWETSKLNFTSFDRAKLDTVYKMEDNKLRTPASKEGRREGSMTINSKSSTRWTKKYIDWSTKMIVYSSATCWAILLSKKNNENYHKLSLVKNDKFKDFFPKKRWCWAESRIRELHNNSSYSISVNFSFSALLCSPHKYNPLKFNTWKKSFFLRVKLEYHHHHRLQAYVIVMRLTIVPYI